MSNVVRALEDTHLDDVMNIVSRAYPALNYFNPDNRKSTRDWLAEKIACPRTGVYGHLREDGVLRGSMVLFDFTMNVHGADVPCGGVGFVAVDLLHKKQKVAYDMLQFFLRHYRAQGAPITALYPFAPPFYKKMGFGFGSVMNVHHFDPRELPHGETCEHVSAFTPDDRPAIAACYERFYQKTHGMIRKETYHIEGMGRRPEIFGVKCVHDGEVRGYLFAQFERGEATNMSDNILLVKELVYETPAAFRELMTFLHRQADQARQVVLHTQDPEFYQLLLDPRNGTHREPSPLFHEIGATGMGIMYRIVDVPGLFRTLADHDFGGQTVRVAFEIDDSFLPENSGRTVVQFTNGRPEVVEGEAELTVALSIADFSSLVMGSVSFQTLYRHGVVQVADEAAVRTLQRLFAVEATPRTLTLF